MKLSFWKTQLIYFSFILINILISYLSQKFLWADLYSSSWFSDQSNLHLINVSDFMLWYDFLIIITLLFPYIWIFYKRYKYVFLSGINSFVWLILLFNSLLHDLFGQCMDFCGFITIFILPIIILLNICVALGILFILNKKNIWKDKLDWNKITNW